MSTGNSTEVNAKGQHCTAFIPGFGHVDGRTRPAKAYEATVAALVADLGGEDVISRAELEIVRRAAGLGVLAQQIEAAIVSGDKVEPTQYQSVANAQGRLLARLGLRRRQRDVTPSLGEYLDQKGAA